MASTNSEDRLMLCLAGLSYRGFWRRSITREEAVRLGIEKGLRDLGLKDWKIKWGPKCFRPPAGWFDDEVLYVAQDAACDHERYVIAIRGTNPISLSDWLFGDLLPRPTAP